MSIIMMVILIVMMMLAMVMMVALVSNDYGPYAPTPLPLYFHFSLKSTFASSLW